MLLLNLLIKPQLNTILEQNVPEVAQTALDVRILYFGSKFINTRFNTITIDSRGGANV
jgi:hypothetical protein